MKREGRAKRTAGGLLVLFALSWTGLRLLSLAFPFPREITGRFGASRVVLDREGRVLRVTPTGLGERLLPVRLEEVSPHLVRAVLAGEDARFFLHRGVDWTAVLRAGFTDLLKGRIVSGASTITMQTARILEPGGPRVVRKVRETFRALQMEEIYPKKRILEIYLNVVPLGGTLRGFEAASRYWFGKGADRLGPEEAAALAAMLPAPTRFRPDRNPRGLLRRRNLVLDRMRNEGFLDDEAWARARRAPLGARPHPWPFLAPHACDLFLGKSRARVIRCGLDLAVQKDMERLVREFPAPGVDGIALVVLEGKSGRIRAMVGSRDYRRRPLNACLCARPAGSTLKPFLYALAFREGVVGAEGLVADEPLRLGAYTPANFDKGFRGSIRASEALTLSRNLPAVRLLRKVGVEAFRDFLGMFGLEFRERALHLDLALGTESVSPLGLARAWGRFVFERPGGAGEREARKRVMETLSSLSPDPAVLPPRRAAWKTGTSSNRRDAWTVGSTGPYVICVWLGNLDDRSDPGLVGRESAARLFARAAAVLGGR